MEVRGCIQLTERGRAEAGEFSTGHFQACPLAPLFAITFSSVSEPLKVVGPISMLLTDVTLAVPSDHSFCPVQSYHKCFLFPRSLLKSIFSCFYFPSFGAYVLFRFQIIIQLTLLFFFFVAYSSVSSNSYLDFYNLHRIQSSTINPQTPLY